MTKLLLGRVLPMGVAAALFTSALSPLRPALGAFSVAANALAGESNAGGTAMPDQLSAPMPGQGFFASLFGPKEKGEDAKEQIQGLVDSLKAKSEAAAAEAAAKQKAKKKPVKPATRGPGRGQAQSPAPGAGP